MIFRVLFLISMGLAFLELGGDARAALRDDAARRAVMGYWETQDRDGVVEIYGCGDDLCGRFRWLKDDDATNPSRDDKNPDPDLRDKKLCGLQFMGGFEADGEKFKNGWIYSPRHGSRFSASLKLRNPDTMQLRGYMLLPVLGETQEWRRVAEPEGLCPVEG